MKNYLFSAMVLLGLCASSFAQTDNRKFPEPDFVNEVTLLKKDNTLMRLEKGSSTMETKTKMGGLGGAESGYTIDGEKSAVRITEGNNLSFIYSTSASSPQSNFLTDSVLKSHGVDPASYKEMSAHANDPGSRITLYKLDVEKGKRKIFLQKGGGIGAKKIQSSDKYTFSVKKIKDGYWVLIIDKPLPKGEYAFSMMDITGTSGSMGSMLFAFGVD